MNGMEELDASQGADRLVVEVVAVVFRVRHRRDQAMPAVKQEGASRDVREVRGGFDRVNAAGFGFKRLERPGRTDFGGLHGFCRITETTDEHGFPAGAGAN